MDDFDLPKLNIHNHALLARKIYEIENADWKQQREWAREGVKSWKLTDDVRLETSNDKMMWYLWAFDNEYRDSMDGFKAVPKMHFSCRMIEKLLKDQPWVHI